MLVASFTELFLQAPLFYKIIRQLVNHTRYVVTLLLGQACCHPYLMLCFLSCRRTVGEKRGKDMSHLTDVVPEGSIDPAPPSEQVATRTWAIGMTISVVLTMVLGKTQVGVRNPSPQLESACR